MDNPTSFTAFFQTVLRPALLKFERVRRIILPCLAVTAIAFLTMGCWAIRSLPPILWLPPIALAAIVVAALRETVLMPGRRKEAFSKNVVIPLVNYAAPGLRPSAFYVGQGDFMDSRLYNCAFDRYEGWDYFSGKRTGYQLSFSWLKVGHFRDGKSSTNRYSGSARPIFTGWFFVAVFPRNFLGGTIVQRDTAEALLGWHGRAVQDIFSPEGMELILLEDSEFEARFKILSTGQLEARYILTPGLMRLAVAVDKRTNSLMSFSFFRNCMYVAIPSPYHYFTWHPTLSFTDPAYCRLLFHAVTGVERMADYIHRNQMIWLDSW